MLTEQDREFGIHFQRNRGTSIRCVILGGSLSGFDTADARYVSLPQHHNRQ